MGSVIVAKEWKVEIRFFLSLFFSLKFVVIGVVTRNIVHDVSDSSCVACLHLCNWELKKALNGCVTCDVQFIPLRCSLLVDWVLNTTPGLRSFQISKHVWDTIFLFHSFPLPLSTSFARTAHANWSVNDIHRTIATHKNIGTSFTLYWDLWWDFWLTRVRELRFPSSTC